MSIPNLKETLDRMFHPRVVAVVGAKQPDYRWVVSQGTLKNGKVYAVNLDRNEWPGTQALGFPTVASLHDIPEPIDYVIVSVPNTVTPAIMRDAIAKRVGGLHFFTAGFSETGTPEGIELEDRLYNMATKAGIPFLGPNCLGIYHPKVGLRQEAEQPVGEGGNVGYLSQSGTLARGFSQYATAAGLKISKSVSFGNGRMVDVADLLEYLAEDADTRIIGMYVEGLRDGRRFFETLRKVARQKPVLAWKVGQTEDAARAAVSHTGNVSPPKAIWEAVLRQCGAVHVNDIEDMVDTMKVLLHFPPLRRDRAGLLAVSGGHASEMADVFSRAGFRIPPIAEESYAAIASYAPLTGGSFRNPFEGPSIRDETNLFRTLDAIERDPNLDFTVVEVTVGAGSERAEAAMRGRFESVKKARALFGKPLCVVLSTANPNHLVDVNKIGREALADGTVALWGAAKAAHALHNAYRYYQQQAWLYGQRP